MLDIDNNIFKDIKRRICRDCGNYDPIKHKCLYYHKKLPEYAYCVVDGEKVFFVK